jgi:hypothetical protein
MTAFNIQSLNSEKFSIRLLQVCTWVLIAMICILIFSICVIKQFPDIGDHDAMSYNAFHGKGILQVHFLYFVLLMLPQLITSNIIAVHVFAVFILTLSVLFKYKLSQRIIREQLADDEINQYSINVLCVILPLFLLLAQNLIYKPSATMFLGFLPLNTWHNSTTVFLFPFAILLFYQSYTYLQKPDAQKCWAIALLMLLNLCIKPSFLISFVIIFPLFCLLRFRFSKDFFYAVFLAFLCGLGLIIQSKIGSYIGTTIISLAIAPLHVWAHWSDQVLLSFLSSLVFPLLFILFYWKLVKTDLLLKYSISLFLAALFFYIVITETGEREFDGNFVWQVIICNYLLFLATAICFLKMYLKKTVAEGKDKLIIIAFLLHVLIGIIYIFKSPIWGFR